MTAPRDDVTSMGGIGEGQDRHGLPQAVAAEVSFLLSRAIEEDVGPGDWTTLWTVPPGLRAVARIVAKERLIVAGATVARLAFEAVDSRLEVELTVSEGQRVDPGSVVLLVRGEARSILTAERTALNFLGRLSGIATQTRAFVDEVDGTAATIIDTRKTTPGWRRLEKWAVSVGGGENHRMGLHDMVLIKDNHIAAAGGIREAVQCVSDSNVEGLPVEVEVTGIAQLRLLRGLGVDRVLLDNMDNETLRMAVMEVAGWPEPRPGLEASGNMTIERVRAVGRTGVNWISVGALTHSVRTVDFSLRLVADVEEDSTSGDEPDSPGSGV
jgi:nicotinate-nucleotide pyrophosphorylase (carboxylating)